MYQIEKNVKMEASHGYACKYPYMNMVKGDSFLVKNEAERLSAYSSAKQWAERNDKDWVFQTRKTKDGFRIWRVA